MGVILLKLVLYFEIKVSNGKVDFSIETIVPLIFLGVCEKLKYFKCYKLESSKKDRISKLKSWQMETTFRQWILLYNLNKNKVMACNGLESQRAKRRLQFLVRDMRPFCTVQTLTFFSGIKAGSITLFTGGWTSFFQLVDLLIVLFFKCGGLEDLQNITYKWLQVYTSLNHLHCVTLYNQLKTWIWMYMVSIGKLFRNGCKKAVLYKIRIKIFFMHWLFQHSNVQEQIQGLLVATLSQFLKTIYWLKPGSRSIASGAPCTEMTKYTTYFGILYRSFQRLLFKT